MEKIDVATLTGESIDQQGNLSDYQQAVLKLLVKIEQNTRKA